MAQYLALRHAAERPDLLDPHPAEMLRRAADAGFIDRTDAERLRAARTLLSDVQGLLRLTLNGDEAAFDEASAPEGQRRLIAVTEDAEDLAELRRASRLKPPRRVLYTAASSSSRRAMPAGRPDGRQKERRMSVEEGKKAPDFTAATDGGKKLKLSELRGKPVVLYFYPKDDTSGCTAEACGFRDSLPDFGKLKAQVIGVSKDTVDKHDKFKKKYGLNFPLVSDEDGKICGKYGTWIEKSLYGRKYMGIERATFLIDKTGTVAKVWHKVKVPGHVDEVLKALKGL